MYFPWKKDIIPTYIIPFLEKLALRHLKPGTRGVLYHLESIRVMPKNDHTYRAFVRGMSAARKGTRFPDGRRGKPTLPIDAFSDNTRQIIKNFDDKGRSLEEYINNGIIRFRKLPNGFKTLVPRWLDQLNYVEVWIEKFGWVQNLEQILKGKDVVIVPNKGNSSIKFLHDNIERLNDWYWNNNRDGKKVQVHVLYLGDLDPAGWAMDNYIRKELSRKCGRWVTFSRIGITLEQITKHLPHLLTPTPDVLAKLSNPKFRAAKPFKQHFGRLFQVELDAMELIPNYEKLITDPIDKLYDQAIHEQVLQRPEYSQEPNVIKKQIKEALEELIYELDEVEEEGTGP